MFTFFLELINQNFVICVAKRRWMKYTFNQTRGAVTFTLSHLAKAKADTLAPRYRVSERFHSKGCRDLAFDTEHVKWWVLDCMFSKSLSLFFSIFSSWIIRLKIKSNIFIIGWVGAGHNQISQAGALNKRNLFSLIFWGPVVQDQGLGG